MRCLPNCDAGGVAEAAAAASAVRALRNKKFRIHRNERSLRPINFPVSLGTVVPQQQLTGAHHIFQANERSQQP